MNRPRFVTGTLHLPSLPLSSWDCWCSSLKWTQIYAGNKDYGDKNYDPLRISLYLLQAQLFSHILGWSEKLVSWVQRQLSHSFISLVDEKKVVSAKTSEFTPPTDFWSVTLRSAIQKVPQANYSTMNMNWPVGLWAGGHFCWKRVMSNLKLSWTLQYQFPLTLMKQTPLTFPKGGFICLHRKWPITPCPLVNRFVLSMQEVELESH